MSVLIEKKGKITTIIINRPQVRNAIDYPTALDLANAFREFDKDEGSHVAVLYGAGGNFCAGADLKAIANNSKDKNRVTEDGDGPLGPTRLRLTKPVIAAVSGYAVAGGLELALWCDLRVCEESAIFGVFCRRWGVPLIDGGTVRLPRLIGLSRALDMILTGRPVKADEAYMMGLANRVVKDGTSLEEAEKLAAQIAEFPQICMRHDRLSAIEQFDYNFDEAMKNELRHGLHALNSKEILDGVRRFTERNGRQKR
jgi:enoyl-CoA hydratase